MSLRKPYQSEMSFVKGAHRGHQPYFSGSERLESMPQLSQS
jgi:hypothetical protein